MLWNGMILVSIFWSRGNCWISSFSLFPVWERKTDRDFLVLCTVVTLLWPRWVLTPIFLSIIGLIWDGENSTFVRFTEKYITQSFPFRDKKIAVVGGRIYFLIYCVFFSLSFFQLKEFEIIGRALPTEKNSSPPLYKMRIFAPDEVIGKSKYWYFVSKLKKIKKSTGEIVSCRRVCIIHTNSLNYMGRTWNFLSGGIQTLVQKGLLNFFVAIYFSQGRPRVF